MMLLAGCVIIFTLEGLYSYSIMPNGDILDGELQECEIEMTVLHKGSILKPPASMDVEIEGLLMNGNDLEDIATFMKDELGFDTITYETEADTFHIFGELAIEDFWSGIGVTSVGASIVPTVPLSEVLGTDVYDDFIQCIVDMEQGLMGEATVVELEMSGVLKDASDGEVGTFILWLDAVKPIQ